MCCSKHDQQQPHQQAQTWQQQPHHQAQTWWQAHPDPRLHCHWQWAKSARWFQWWAILVNVMISMRSRSVQVQHNRIQSSSCLSRWQGLQKVELQTIWHQKWNKPNQDQIPWLITRRMMHGHLGGRWWEWWYGTPRIVIHLSWKICLCLIPVNCVFWLSDLSWKTPTSDVPWTMHSTFWSKCASCVLCVRNVDIHIFSDPWIMHCNSELSLGPADIKANKNVNIHCGRKSRKCLTR